MSQIVKLRRSSVSGQKPTNTNLQLGELALNTTDGKVFMAVSGSLGPTVEEVILTNTVNTGAINLMGDITASGLRINGDAVISSSMYIGTGVGDFINIKAVISSSLLPDSDGDTHNVGIPNRRWKSVHAVTGAFDSLTGFSGGTLNINDAIITGSFTGSFNGDGSQLYNIPASGVTGLSLNKIISGSVSASISPDKGLEINANTVITGSLIVTNGIGYIDTGLIAQNSDLLLTSGSNVYVENGGIVSASQVWGDGSHLINIPASGVTGLELYKIVSGSVSASISPDRGLEINTDTTITGSLTITGSTTQIGNNTLLGTTLLSGSITISGSLDPSTPSVRIYGDTQTDGVIRFDPVSKNIDNSISASYLFVSSSTNDLYFSQNGNGFSNTTRLRWIEGSMYTGLLNGGKITATTGTTTFNIDAGSGIIVNLNASLTDNPYPTIKYVNWNAFTGQTLTYRTTHVQTYIAIDNNGQIVQSNSPFIATQYNTLITLGTVIHQNLSTVNASITYPNVAYGYKQRTYDFVKAFGPLKLSGLNLVTTGSLGLNVGSGTAFADGRNYQTDPNNPSYITDSGTAVSKIFRYYHVSGSTFVQDTNSGAGYTEIDPTKYVNNGVLTSVVGDYTIQRVFWYPNSATKGIAVYYGNATYSTIREAIDNLSIEPFVETENTKQNAVYLGSIIIAGNGDFTQPNKYTIIPGGLFRSIGGTGGGGTVPTQRLFDLSDVDVTTQQDNDLLVYNVDTLKWESGKSLNGDYEITGSINVTNSVTSSLFTGSFKGDGSGLYNIPASGVTGLQLDKIINGNASASIDNNGFYVNRDVYIDGTITAREIHTDYVTSSVLFQSGSTKFGDTSDDTHQFTGSVNISGSLNASTITGSFSGDALGLTNVPFHITGSDVDGIQNDKQFTKLHFDSDTGLNVSESAPGTAFISIGSHFRDIFVSGSGMLRATGSDAFEVIGYGGIDVTVNNVDSNYDGLYDKELVFSAASLSSSLNDRIDVITGSLETTTTAFNNYTNSIDLFTSSVVLTSETASMTVLSASFAATAAFALNAGGGTEGRTAKLVQSSAATTWTFNHNLGEQYPAVTIYDDNDYVVIPTSVEAVSANQLVINFSSAQTGTAVATVGGGLPMISGSYDGRVLAVDGNSPAWKEGIISGSLQIQEYGFASTGSNTFNGDQTINGALTLSEALIKQNSLTNLSSDTNIGAIPTGSYDAAFFEYVLKSGSNMRAGSVMSVWDGTTVKFNEVTTNDIGDTTGVTMSVTLSSGNANLHLQISSGTWAINVLTKGI